MKLIVRAQNFSRHQKRIQEIEGVAVYGGNLLTIENRPGQVILISEESPMITVGAVVLKTLDKKEVLKASPDLYNHFKNFSWFRNQDLFFVITNLVMPIPNRSGISATIYTYWEAQFLRTMYDMLINAAMIESHDQVLCLLKNHEISYAKEMGNWPLELCPVSGNDEDALAGGFLEMTQESYQTFSDAWLAFDKYERDLEWKQSRMFSGTSYE